MNILLITSSARGHAIADALARSPQKPDIFSICTTRNPGIRRIAVAQEVTDIMDFPTVLAHAKAWHPDFAIIGPDDPIGAGLADLLEEHGISTVAPRKMFARIESSKGFARELLRKYGIDASPQFRIFPSTLSPVPSPAAAGEGGVRTEIRRFIDDDLHGNYVVKYDALKGGKGVKVSDEHLHSIDEGVAYALQCIEECGQVVIEEKLVGCEFSLMSFVSGTRVVHMPLVQDHKRAYDGDTGPNTGGMGSYSMPDYSLPFLTSRDLERAKEINQLVAEALSQPSPFPLPSKGEGYKGILYGGYMVTKNGVKVIEFNARFGDPEALNVLPILTSDFVDICQGILTGELTQEMVRFDHKATVCKYIVPRGYPENREQKGERIQLPPLPLPLPRCGRGGGETPHPLPFKGEGMGEGSQKNFRIFFG
ncbi:phosphoribosylamine--glycine ligase, partial [Candidatus Peregrinibacteria bacterium]|nr:phosphoribosylamine--glycine ligase [Candidatus Peregrinibacteria bacterium]